MKYKWKYLQIKYKRNFAIKGDCAMCGIIGKIGIDDVVPQLLNGLSRLEYRGYDSSGIAILEGSHIKCFRSVGRIDGLREKVGKENLQSICGIAHTRWATHGKPTEENAHPHRSPSGTFAVVHNGIIENSEEIKRTLLKGNEFKSETDTEVFAHLLEKYYSEDVVSAIANACAVLKGSYAFGILCDDTPGMIYGAASGSPLVVAKGDDGIYLSSDLDATGEDSSEFYRVKHGEICAVDSDTIIFFDASGKEIRKSPEDIYIKRDEYSKGDYEYYMLKEIYEQPDAVRRTLESLIAGDSIELPQVSLRDEFFIENIENIVIVACGSAYHTGLVGRCVIEKLCKIPCSVEIASEFRYAEPLINEKTLAVFVSQSGETADTLASLRLAARRGAQVLSIVNVRGSIIAEESENVIYTRAGKEVAVATTKAYSAQLAAFYALALYMASLRRTIDIEKQISLVRELKTLPDKIEETLRKCEEKAKSVACAVKDKHDVFYIGRLSDFATASEGSLKLKEISYINSQAYASGELKHGTISLVEKGTPVVAVAGEKSVFRKTLSNISEVVSRGADVTVVTDEGKEKYFGDMGDVISVSSTADEFLSSLLVLPLQLMGYYTALYRGCDIDKPKNLAKSVTVE